MNITPNVTEFLQDALYTLAIMTRDMDRYEDNGDVFYAQLQFDRRELNAFVTILTPKDYIVGGNMWLFTADWTDEDIIAEIHYFRNKHFMSGIPPINYNQSEIIHQREREINLFTDLLDTPSGYENASYSLVRVNFEKTALEFVPGMAIKRPTRFVATAGQTDFVVPNAATNEIVEIMIASIGGIPQSKHDYAVIDTNVIRDTVKFNTPVDEGVEVVLEYFTNISTLIGLNTVDWGDIRGTISNQIDLQEAFDNKEDYLGVPNEEGAKLASTIAGVRYWASASDSGVDIKRPTPYIAAVNQTDYVIPGATSEEIVDILLVTVGGVPQTKDDYFIKDTIVSRDTVALYIAPATGDEVVIEYFRLVPSIQTAMAESFLALTDTPSSYIGKALSLPIVNATESGLTFIPLPDMLPEAPIDGKIYGRKHAAWEPIISAIQNILYIDPINGDDVEAAKGGGTPFKTPLAAVTYSVPDVHSITWLAGDYLYTTAGESWIKLDVPMHFETGANIIMALTTTKSTVFNIDDAIDGNVVITGHMNFYSATGFGGSVTPVYGSFGLKLNPPAGITYTVYIEFNKAITDYMFIYINGNDGGFFKSINIFGNYSHIIADDSSFYLRGAFNDVINITIEYVKVLSYLRPSGWNKTTGFMIYRLAEGAVCTINVKKLEIESNATDVKGGHGLFIDYPLSSDALITFNVDYVVIINNGTAPVSLMSMARLQCSLVCNIKLIEIQSPNASILSRWSSDLSSVGKITLNIIEAHTKDTAIYCVASTEDVGFELNVRELIVDPLVAAPAIILNGVSANKGVFSIQGNITNLNGSGIDIGPNKIKEIKTEGLVLNTTEDSILATIATDFDLYGPITYNSLNLTNITLVAKHVKYGHLIKDNDIIKQQKEYLNFKGLLIENLGNDTIVEAKFEKLTDVNSLNKEDGDIPVYNAATNKIELQKSIVDTNTLRAVEPHKKLANQILFAIVPKGYMIQFVIMKEVGNNAAGNIGVGTTLTGTDIIAPTTMNANAEVKAVISKDYFSSLVDTNLYLNSSLWGNGEVSLYFTFVKLVNSNT